MKTLVQRLLFRLLVLAILAVYPCEAFADGTTNATGAENAGSLTITSPLSFTFPITLSSSTTAIKNSPVGDSLTIVDNTGTANGWHVNVSALTFTEAAPSGGFAAGTSPITLTGATLIFKSSGVFSIGGGGTNPTISTGVTITNTPASIISAPQNGGIGTWGLGFNAVGRPPAPINYFTLSVPSDEKVVDSVNYPSGATPYNGSIIWDIVSGP